MNTADYFSPDGIEDDELIPESMLEDDDTDREEQEN